MCADAWSKADILAMLLLLISLSITQLCLLSRRSSAGHRARCQARHPWRFISWCAWLCFAERAACDLATASHALASLTSRKPVIYSHYVCSGRLPIVITFIGRFYAEEWLITAGVMLNIYSCTATNTHCCIEKLRQGCRGGSWEVVKFASLLVECEPCLYLSYFCRWWGGVMQWSEASWYFWSRRVSCYSHKRQNMVWAPAAVFRFLRPHSSPTPAVKYISGVNPVKGLLQSLTVL